MFPSSTFAPRPGWRDARAIRLILVLALPPTVFASPTPSDKEPHGKSDWRLILGAGALYRPDYPGSDDLETRAVPLIFAEYGERLYLRGTTAGARLWGNGVWGLDAVARYHSGRDSDDNSILEGLEDIDAGVDGGLALNVGRGPWKAQLAVYQDISSSHDGLYIDLEAGRTFTLNPRLQLELEASATWADADFTDAYFGITPDQAMTTGLPVHEAEAGMKDVGLSLGLNYSPGRHWLVRAQVGVARLLGDAADSPLVEDHGSATQPRAALSIGYRF